MEIRTGNENGNEHGDGLMRLLMRGDVFSRLVLDADDVCRIVPEAGAMIGFDQRNPHHPYDAWVHTAHAVAYAAPVPILRLTLLFHDLGKPEAFYLAEDGVGHFNRHEAKGEVIVRRRLPALGFDERTVETVAALTLYHDLKITEEDLPRWDAALGRERMLQLLDVQEADVRAHAEAYKKIQLAKIETFRNRLSGRSGEPVGSGLSGRLGGRA